MANNLNNFPPFPSLKRIAQINSYFCGPATLQMLLSFYGHNIDQQSIVDALDVNSTIRLFGLTINQMGQYIRLFFPDLQFWFKFNATITDLSQIVNNFHYPAGVEWQGVFDYPDEEIHDDEDDDPGHIAIVTAIDTRDNFVQIADPDQHYAGTDRRFSILQFEYRWWDINTIIDPITRKHQEIGDYHGLFIITPKTDSSPEQLHLNRI